MTEPPHKNVLPWGSIIWIRTRLGHARVRSSGTAHYAIGRLIGDRRPPGKELFGTTNTDARRYLFRRPRLNKCSHQQGERQTDRIGRGRRNILPDLIRFLGLMTLQGSRRTP